MNMKCSCLKSIEYSLMVSKEKAKLIIEIPDGDIRSISEAYRIGFAATALAKSKSINEAEKSFELYTQLPR